uniref:ANK_REP_REGION domain-containing protein n=1 Tax=Strongyloides stercoralis TaxID=6248 RepID=A0A0K0DWD2_STRER
MNCTEENVKFLDNPKQTVSVIHQIIPNENFILKSHVFISFYDTKSFVFDEGLNKSHSFLTHFLFESLKYKKCYKSNFHMYIDVRGGIIYNNLLYDLKFSLNSKNGLVASLGNNFDKWFHLYAPNFFNMSIISLDDIYNCTNIFKESIKEIQLLLSKTRNDFPRVYIVDFIRNNQNDKKNYHFGKWVFIDIPCFNNSNKNYEILSWLQSEDFFTIQKCDDKIKHNPLYTAMKGFLYKNIRTVICFTTKNSRLKTEFNNIKKIFLQLKLFVDKDTVISAKSYNKYWYLALNDIEEIFSLGRLITYVSAITGKEEKKRRKVSDIKKIENTLKHILEKFLNSNISEDLGLINHKIFETKIGYGTRKSICALICDVWHSITQLDKKLFKRLKGEKFISVNSDDENIDNISTSDYNLDVSNCKKKINKSIVKFQKILNDWDECYRPLLDSFIKEVNFQPEESLSQIINRLCPNIKKEHDFIRKTLNDDTKKLDIKFFDILFNKK